MSKKNRTHPGLTIKHDCLEALGLSVTAGAKALGVTRQTLNNLVNCKSGISPEMAIRLSQVFGSTPEMWLRIQASYDLSQLRLHEEKNKIKLKRVQSLQEGMDNASA